MSVASSKLQACSFELRFSDSMPKRHNLNESNNGWINRNWC